MTYGTLKVNTIVTGTQTVNLDDIVYKSDLSFDSDITLTGSSALKLYDSDSSNYISVQAANVLAADTTYRLSGDGGSGQFLRTDGSGNLSWATAVTDISGLQGQITSNDSDITALQTTVQEIECLQNLVSTLQYKVNALNPATVTNVQDIEIGSDTATGVFADADAAVNDPNGNEGWYYTNTNLGDKINWYFYAQVSSPINYVLSDFQGWFAVVDKKNTTSELWWDISTPALGDGNDAGSWYRSKRRYQNYAFESAPAGKYLIHSPGLDVSSIETSLPRMVFETCNNNEGPQADNEVILFMSIHTNSSHPAGENSFTVEKVGYQLTSADANNTISTFTLKKNPN